MSNKGFSIFKSIINKHVDSVAQPQNTTENDITSTTLYPSPWMNSIWQWEERWGVSILPRTATELNSLRELAFADVNFFESDIEITNLPKEIGRLTNLQTLSLGSASHPEIYITSIHSLPEEIGDLKNLQNLFLQFNSLDSLPRGIGKLSLLEDLKLGGNNLKRLPKEISGLRSLKVFTMWSNKLVDLPREIGTLKQLEVLDLSYNNLSSLPSSIINLTNLKRLYLSNNNRLILSESQVDWIKSLIELDCDIDFSISDFRVEHSTYFQKKEQVISSLVESQNYDYSDGYSDNPDADDELLSIFSNDGSKSKIKKEIQKICSDKNIEHLVHFTRVENLPTIMDKGLMSLQRLKESDQDFRFNDSLRLDNHTNTISISISFPNSKMFYKYRNKNIRWEWAVLLLKPDILWERPCLFCSTNAASSKMRWESGNFSKPEHLLNMFEESFERTEYLEEHYTTDEQAEVLVKDFIPPENILKVVFEDQQTLDQNRGHIKNARAVIDEDYFSSREYFLKSK